MAVSKLQKDKKSANKMYDPLNKMYDPFSLDISGEEYLYEYKKNGKVKSKNKYLQTGEIIKNHPNKIYLSS